MRTTYMEALLHGPKNTRFPEAAIYTQRHFDFFPELMTTCNSLYIGISMERFTIGHHSSVTGKPGLLQ